MDAFIANNVPSANTVWLNAAACFLCGDCDRDGDVDILDALQAAQFASGLLTPSPSDFQRYATWMQMGISTSSMPCLWPSLPRGCR